jgi:predicted RNase H-like HicB family nuclease
VKGYVVVFEGDQESGFSAYSPDLPGVVAAGETREETESLMREAMSEHLAVLRDMGLPVPQPSSAAEATILNVSAA